MDFENVDVYDFGHAGLVAGFIKQIGLIEYIDHLLPKKQACNVTHGQAIAAMLLNALGFHSQALYLVPDFFNDKPLDLLIAPGLTNEHFNDDVLGRALDAVFDYGTSELFSGLSLKALQTLKITPKSINLDLTSFHVDGTAYNDNNPDNDKHIRLVQGYSRDHRPELNQAILALITDNVAGIPIYLEALSGNAEDKSTFQEIVKNQLESLKSAESCQYLIADSALFTKATIQALDKQNRYFITRVSSVSKDAKAVINNPDFDAFKPFDDGYEGYYTQSHYADVAQKWLVIRSEAGKHRALKTFDKDVAKGEAREQKQLQRLMKKSFFCEQDALRELEAFKLTLKYTEVSAEEVIVIPKYKGRGAPKKNAEPDGYEYKINASIAVSSDKIEQAKLNLGIFILSTNNIETTPCMAELLQLYKSQQRVERGFRFLKDPSFMTASFYVEKPSRIEALLFLMTTALLVYAGLEYQIRTKLVDNKRTVTNSIKKQTNKPTLKWLFLKFMKVKCLIHDKKTVYIKGMDAEHKMIIQLLGDPYLSIYRVPKNRPLLI